MAKRIVVWTETASKQRKEILKYWTIKNGSTSYANKLIKITRSRVNVILKNPLAFKLTNHNETRVSSLGHFSIFYQITTDKLIITAFWDNRQDPKIILELLKNGNT